VSVGGQNCSGAALWATGGKFWCGRGSPGRATSLRFTACYELTVIKPSLYFWTPEEVMRFGTFLPTKSKSAVGRREHSNMSAYRSAIPLIPPPPSSIQLIYRCFPSRFRNPSIFKLHRNKEPLVLFASKPALSLGRPSNGSLVP
jgi:hypothetical protein